MAIWVNLVISNNLSLVCGPPLHKNLPSHATVNMQKTAEHFLTLLDNIF